MKIGIIGTGNVGSALGKGWASQGHEVVFSTRQPHGEKVQKLLAEVGEARSCGSTKEKSSDNLPELFLCLWRCGRRQRPFS